MEACTQRLVSPGLLGTLTRRVSSGLTQLDHSAFLPALPYHLRSSRPAHSVRKPNGITSVLAREPASHSRQGELQSNPLFWSDSPFQEAERPALEPALKTPAALTSVDHILNKHEATAVLEQVLQLPDPLLQRTAPLITHHYAEVFHGATKLRVNQDGSLELYRSKEGQELFVASGQVQLPESAAAVWAAEVLSDGAMDVRWGEVGTLRVVPVGAEVAGAANQEAGWAADLEEGFVLEWSVKNEPSTDHMAEVTLDMHTAGHWFGGGHFMRQHWPLNLGAFEVGPFFPFDNGPNGLNTLTSPHWVTSKGLLVLADSETPFLHVGMNAPLSGEHGDWIERVWGVGVQNLSREYLPSPCQGHGDGLLRIQARNSYKCHKMLHPLRDWIPPQWRDEERSGGGRLSVKFALCAHRNVREATLASLMTMKKPPNPPPQEMVRAPIWTTWARYHAKVTQEKVEKYATEIVARDMDRSIMEIDDRWQRKYGDFDFDSDKFPDPKAMVDHLHALGFKVTLWIMPFAEEDSNAYREGGPLGYFISADAVTKGLKPGFFRWWQPKPAVALDVTNPDAVRWFVRRLKKLQTDYSIDGFKFDAGEPCFLPPMFKTFKPIMSPLEYTRLYVQEVASAFPLAEVRTGHKTTNVPLLTRMGDRFSTWSSGNGLRSVIPTLLTSGLLGYPFCLPDMIGGNAYFGRKPDVELLVRWAQANALMPAMQFSIPPWDLSKEADKLCQAALAIRKNVQQQISSLAEDACKNLAPICRPMWWMDPEDEQTFVINDQYAIGDDLIVAPVVVKGQKSRDVYLPKGHWCDLLNPDEVYEGGQWLRDIPTPITKLPIFRRVTSPADVATNAGESASPLEGLASQLIRDIGIPTEILTAE